MHRPFSGHLWPIWPKNRETRRHTTTCQFQRSDMCLKTGVYRFTLRMALKHQRTMMVKRHVKIHHFYTLFRQSHTVSTEVHQSTGWTGQSQSRLAVAMTIFTGCPLEKATWNRRLRKIWCSTSYLVIDRIGYVMQHPKRWTSEISQEWWWHDFSIFFLVTIHEVYCITHLNFHELIPSTANDQQESTNWLNQTSE